MGGLRCQAIQTEHGPYIAERTQKAVYIVICLWGAYIEEGHAPFCLTISVRRLAPAI
jgi:hypothetical protein